MSGDNDKPSKLDPKIIDWGKFKDFDGYKFYEPKPDSYIKGLPYDDRYGGRFYNINPHPSGKKSLAFEGFLEGFRVFPSVEKIKSILDGQDQAAKDDIRGKLTAEFAKQRGEGQAVLQDGKIYVLNIKVPEGKLVFDLTTEIVRVPGTTALVYDFGKVSAGADPVKYDGIYKLAGTVEELGLTL